MNKLFTTLLLSAVVVAPVGFSISAAQAATSNTNHQMSKPHHTSKSSSKAHHKTKSSHASKPHKNTTAMNKSTATSKK
ncbi:hypothetical protein IQ264_13775 [Phormidium sp. LEGE 05292]|uniref:hypothetical protein n=1 Tax=[Phormidium] sp. LEGE 05292 TaxID=767427 RepID=UPI00187EC113|nr:hypothetical protein [Phormidium sp. LEGE 05292]MBE9226492.1 hypothetical protein [Phormidium sp. LEGE 05292]